MIERTFSVSRLSCQFCVGKNHCGRCSRETAERLLACPGVLDARVDLKAGTAWLKGTEEDALLDALEEAGLMAG